ncbi:oxygen-independent coproporphyrinogen-III oxidase-like protein LL1139 [candidate division SR1 bacterium]|nr:oxygen-independent coproporphyrinogen-III oxidase-like protein LL1139 [candidate division SR1 bacterium]
MLSLYIHIPFCSQICPYCSFAITANQSPDIISDYLVKLHQEIDFYALKYPRAEIKTLYFGGGTPNLIGTQEIKKLIDHVFSAFDCENLAELSIEYNPFPHDDILKFVSDLNNYYRKLSRLRFSFGIQSLDNSLLQSISRPYSFLGMVDFFRALQPLKQDNNIFNFDFIAFGKFNQTKKGNSQLRNPSALSFFSDFVNSHFADSFSLYTLEISPHQLWNRLPHFVKPYGTEDEIYEEFDILKEILLDAGYSRYEISNFSLISKSSIHNRVYREMEPYLGLGLGASSLLTATFCEVKDEKVLGVRQTNTSYLHKYLTDPFSGGPDTEIITLSPKDYLIESFFLALRTDFGVHDLEKYASILVPDYREKINQMETDGLLIYHDNRLILTDRGMDVYSWIITELMSEI